MAHEHVPHTIKIEPVEQMTARVQQKSPMRRSGPHTSGLKFRIPRKIWNSYDPKTYRITKPAVRLKLKLTPATTEELSKTATPPQPTSPKDPTHCKVKLWKFHYGGPRRKRKGHSRHEITYEQPCLQPTCANCWRWHSHLLQIDRRTDSDVKNQQDDRPHEEPISPQIDPRILDGTCKDFASRRSSVKSQASTVNGRYGQTPVLTPVKTSFNFNHDQQLPNHPNISQLRMSYPTPSAYQYSIFLPTTLLTSTLSTNSTTAKTKWLSGPRMRYTARLTFASHEGKQKYRVLLRGRQKREEKREYDRVRRARLRMEREEKRDEGEGERRDTDVVRRTVRCRHRVRLVFRSKEGREGFKNIMGRGER